MNAKQKTTAQVAHAVKVVREKIAALYRRIDEAKGEDKIALEKEMKELMAQIGMNYTPDKPAPEGATPATEGSEGAAEPVGLGGRILFNLNQAEATLNGGGSEADMESTIDSEQLFEAPSSDPAPTLSLWTRFKNWVGRNKVTLLVSAAALAAAGGAAYYYTRGNTAATSTVSSMAEAATETAGDSTSIFSSIGQWFARVGSAIKGYAVAAYNWVANLFTKAAPEAPAVDVPVTAAA